MKKTTKLLAILLTLIMCMGILPMSAFAEAPTYNVGDIIEFGSYPQSEVKDEALLNVLNAQELTWISYGYYSGDGANHGSMVQGDYAKYADVSIDGEKYRAVRFTGYRAILTAFPTTSIYSTYQGENGYFIDTTYWFKYEPLRWQVLDPSTGFVLCKICIDSQTFTDMDYGDNGEYNNPECTVNANDYETSTIREWLNDDFYNTAFSSGERSKIALTTLDNSDTVFNEYNGESTTDKMFLPSYDDMLNTAYGFSDSASANDSARIAKSTDYAKSQGCFQSSDVNNKGNAMWRLRSPGSYRPYACIVDTNGCVGTGSDGYAQYTYIGIRPAMCLNLETLGEEAKTIINHIEVSNTQVPAVGESVAWTAPTFPSGANYEQFWFTQWAEHETPYESFEDLAYDFDADNNWYSAYRSDDFTFKAGYYYTLAIWILPKSGCEFAPIDEITGKINGNSAEISDIEFAEDGYMILYTTYDLTGEEVTLTGIEIVSPPSTKEWKYKTDVSTDGLMVVANYDNGTSVDVTDLVDFDNYSAHNKRGNYTATVKYEGKTATFDYSVKYTFFQWIIKIILFGWIWY